MCCFRDWSFTAIAAVVLNFTKWFSPEQEPEDKNVGKSPSQLVSITYASSHGVSTGKQASWKSHVLAANLLGLPSLGSSS